MFRWIRNLGRRLTGPGHGVLTVRRFDAADTNRLNKAHWATTTGSTINAALSTRLTILRQRAEYELANNAIAEGVVETFVTDAIGEHGPALQILGAGSNTLGDFAKIAEDIWSRWWLLPDVNGQLAGVDLLSLGARSMFPNGEFIWQKVTADGAEHLPRDDPRSFVSLRLQDIAPRRLVTPLERSGQTDVTLGVRRTKSGRPLEYFIQRATENEFDMVPPTESDPVRAADIIHAFRTIESGQARGVPWLTTGLPVIADLRDYDAEVLDAARQAADNSILLSTKNEDATFIQLDGSVDIERRVISALPPGYEATQMKAEQPSTSYKEYRQERMREIGAPIGMPLMKIAHDASNHNYSSARFDAQQYQEGVRRYQAWIARKVLNPLVEAVITESVLAGRLTRPAGVRLVFSWSWPQPPHVDPKKEAEAMAIRRANLTTTLAQELLREKGVTLEAHIEALQRERDAFRDADLELPRPGSQSRTVQQQVDDAIDDRSETPIGGRISPATNNGGR